MACARSVGRRHDAQSLNHPFPHWASNQPWVVGYELYCSRVVQRSHDPLGLRRRGSLRGVRWSESHGYKAVVERIQQLQHGTGSESRLETRDCGAGWDAARFTAVLDSERAVRNGLMVMLPPSLPPPTANEAGAMPALRLRSNRQRIGRLPGVWDEDCGAVRAGCSRAGLIRAEHGNARADNRATPTENQVER